MRIEMKILCKNCWWPFVRMIQMDWHQGYHIKTRKQQTTSNFVYIRVWKYCWWYKETHAGWWAKILYRCELHSLPLFSTSINFQLFSSLIIIHIFHLQIPVECFIKRKTLKTYLWETNIGRTLFNDIRFFQH